MVGCSHKICIDCARAHFTLLVKEKGVVDFTCIFNDCKKVDTDNRDEFSTYLGQLSHNVFVSQVLLFFNKCALVYYLVEGHINQPRYGIIRKEDFGMVFR